MNIMWQTAATRSVMRRWKRLRSHTDVGRKDVQPVDAQWREDREDQVETNMWYLDNEASDHMI